jgi:hypothetical protein
MNWPLLFLLFMKKYQEARNLTSNATYKSAQFMKQAENEQIVAQFVKWARVEASS